MKVRTLYLILLIFITVLWASCQEKKSDNKEFTKEEALITKTIDMYFEGWMTGDTTMLGKAMHATCQLKNVKENEVLVFDRATYLGFFKPRPRRENSEGRIIDIDITGNVAAAKIELEIPKRLYTDYFNMMKIEEEWFIVDKISTNVAIE